ncbi:MFS transporter [Paenibacillus sp. MBLB4367]|uniref:MFS transporter n=1 Tax=Paenibacillus sp. MBLB4367 TaxID=3384767 RepID=UPI003908134F
MIFRASQLFLIMRFVASLAGSTMFTTYSVYYVATLGLNPFQLLLVGAVLELTVLVFEGITGVVADTYGRRRSVVTGMFILGFGFMLEGSVLGLEAISPMISLFVWVLIAQFFYGLGHTFVSGADTAWIVDEVGEENAGSLFMRAKSLSLLAVLLGIALSVGLSTLAPNLPYVIGGAMYAGLGFFLLFYMKETRFVPLERTEGTSRWLSLKTTWLSGMRAVRRQPVLLMILVVTVFSGAASEGYDRLWQAHLISGIGFPQQVAFSMALWFGIIAVVTTLLSMLAVHLAEKRLDMGNERIVFAGMLILTGARIAAVVCFAFSPNFAWAIGSVLLLGVIGALSGPLFDTWLNLNIESKVRATVLSMMSQSDALGQTAGGPLVGWVGSRHSIRASLVVAAILLSPILIVFGRALRKKA